MIFVCCKDTSQSVGQEKMGEQQRVQRTDMNNGAGSRSRPTCPNTLLPDRLEGYFTRLLSESTPVPERDMSDLHGVLSGQLTEEQVACLRRSSVSKELGKRAELIEVGMSPRLVLDEVIGRRLAIQLNVMGLRGKRLVIYEAGGERHELSISEAISLMQLCRDACMPSIVTLTGVEVAPGIMTPYLSTFPIIELHSLSVGSEAPPIEQISPIIHTGTFVQVQALSITKASEISRNSGSDVASGHGGIRSRKYDGLTVDVGGPPDFFLRRGCSCSEEEARAWALQHLPPEDIAAAKPPVVFLCRVVTDGEGRRYPVLSTATAAATAKGV